MNIDVKEFKNFGYFLIDLKEEQLSVVKNEITEIQNNKDTAVARAEEVGGKNLLDKIKDKGPEMRSLLTKQEEVV